MFTIQHSIAFHYINRHDAIYLDLMEKIAAVTTTNTSNVLNKSHGLFGFEFSVDILFCNVVAISNECTASNIRITENSTQWMFIWLWIVERSRYAFYGAPNRHWFRIEWDTAKAESKSETLTIAMWRLVVSMHLC